MQETPCGYTIMAREHANNRERGDFASATRDGKMRVANSIIRTEKA